MTSNSVTVFTLFMEFHSYLTVSIAGKPVNYWGKYTVRDIYRFWTHMHHSSKLLSRSGLRFLEVVSASIGRDTGCSSMVLQAASTMQSVQMTESLKSSNCWEKAWHKHENMQTPCAPSVCRDLCCSRVTCSHTWTQLGLHTTFFADTMNDFSGFFSTVLIRSQTLVAVFVQTFVFYWFCSTNIYSVYLSIISTSRINQDVIKRKSRSDCLLANEWGNRRQSFNDRTYDETWVTAEILRSKKTAKFKPSLFVSLPLTHTHMHTQDLSLLLANSHLSLPQPRKASLSLSMFCASLTTLTTCISLSHTQTHKSTYVYMDTHSSLPTLHPNIRDMVLLVHATLQWHNMWLMLASWSHAGGSS